MDGVNHWSALMPEALFRRNEPLGISDVVKKAAGDLEDTYTVVSGVDPMAFATKICCFVFNQAP